MEYRLTPEQAAEELDHELRPQAWYVSVGVGRAASGPALYLYVRSTRHKELRKLEAWRGYPVYVRAIGRVSPIGAR